MISTTPREQMHNISIVIADGMPLVAESIASMVNEQDDMHVAAACNSLDDALRYCAGHKPDILLVEAPDVAGPQNLGILKDKLAEISPKTRVVMLTVRRHAETLQAGLDAGIESCVAKEQEPGRLLEAIRKTASGDSYLCPTMLLSLVHKQRGDHAGLTGREIDVLKLVGLGFTNREIGQNMHLSVRTVESHRASLQEKLGVHTRAGLVREALDRDLVS